MHAFPYPPVKDSDPAVVHAAFSDNAAPHIRQFAGTINLGFSVGEDKRSIINVYLLLKHVMAFAKHTDGAFRIDPMNGSEQCITNPSNTPTTKEGVNFITSTVLLMMESGEKSMFPCSRRWVT
jgi:hypothetical protein